MRVRTIRKHRNAFPPVAVKHPGRKYEVGDRDAMHLISAGYVEEDVPLPEATDEAQG